MNTKIKFKTPLSRAENRLKHWEDTLSNCLKSNSIQKVGAITIQTRETEDDKKILQPLIENAEAAIKDWKTIIRAINSYDELLEALKNLASLADGKVNGDDNDDMRDWEKALYKAQELIRSI